jgi:hypothetical protein
VISSKSMGRSRSLRLGVLVAAAAVVGAMRSCIRPNTPEPLPNQPDPVPQELFAIATDALKAERGFGDRYGVRGATLVGAAGIVTGLTVNLGTTVLTRLPPNEAREARVLHLGGVGEPLFVLFFVGSMLLLALSAALATFALLPRDPEPVEPEDLREFMEERKELPYVRHRLYKDDLRALTNQRGTNEKKRKLVGSAGILFVVALFCLMVNAGVLVATVL